MGYREDWFRKNRNPLGLYQCVNCHKFYPESEIDIDHIIPKSKGGTNALWNLQPMCKHCNRSKQDDTDKTLQHLARNSIRNALKKAFRNCLRSDK